MNFQLAPKPFELTWVPPKGTGKTKTASATFGGRRLCFQVPASRTRMFRENSSTTLYLSLDTPLHDKFRAFVEEYEQYASGLGHAQGKAISSSVKESPGYAPSFRLSVWETQWFDETGQYLKEPPLTMTACSCILEFQGCC